MSTPAITVLMTVYQAERYLESSIRSILGQTFRDFEFLIVDDGSRDASPALLKNWARQDSRIRLILNTQNKGQTPCLNEGIAAAKAPWIARQDADDLSHPRRLELQMDAIARQPALGLIGTNGWLIDGQGAFTGLINAPVGEPGITWSSIFYNPFLHSSVCFRKAAVDVVGVYDPALRIAQDYDLWLRIMEKYPVANLPERLLTYRVHAGSLSNEGRETTRREADASCGQALRHAGLGDFAQPEWLALLGEFREGSPALSGAKFWPAHAELLAAFLKQQHLEGREPSLRDAIALLHWKLGGALGRSLPALKEVAAALACSPRLVGQMLASRIFGPR